jgi:hypothetical protein
VAHEDNDAIDLGQLTDGTRLDGVIAREALETSDVL